MKPPIARTLGLLLVCATLWTPVTSKAAGSRLLCRTLLAHTLNDPVNGQCAPTEEPLLFLVPDTPTEVTTLSAKVNADGTVASQSTIGGANWIAQIGHADDYDVQFTEDVFAHRVACSAVPIVADTGVALSTSFVTQTRHAVEVRIVDASTRVPTAVPFDLVCSGN